MMLAKIGRFFKRDLGEVSKHQTEQGPLGRTPVMGGHAWHLGNEASKGTYATYREMRTDPTIALARAAGTAAIKAADYSVQADPEAPPQAVQLIEDAAAVLWGDYIRDALFGRDYGWAPFEKLWANRDGAFTIERLKPLRVDDTKVMVDGHGNVCGLRMPEEKNLWLDKSMLYTYDPECGNPYGRSIYENIRAKAWDPWTNYQQQLTMIAKRAAGTIPLIRFPAGKHKATGTDYADIAKSTLDLLSSSRGVAFPWEYQDWAGDLLRKGVDPTKLLSWQIDVLKFESGHGTEILNAMRYCDTLKLRGMLVPERAATEGTNGTKAEAETHGALGVSMQELDYEDMVKQFNKGAVDDMLSANWGPAMRGKVYVVPAPLVDEDKALLRQIVTAVLTNPQNIDLLYGVTDLDAMIEETGLPQRANVQPAIPNNPELSPNTPRPPYPDPNAITSTRLSKALSLAFRRGFGIGRPAIE